MSLSEPVAVVIGSLIAAMGSGGATVWIGRRKPKRATPDRVQTALEKRAKELDDRLAAQYEKRIAYLEAQCENRDRTIADLQKQLRGSRSD